MKIQYIILAFSIVLSVSCTQSPKNSNSGTAASRASIAIKNPEVKQIFTNYLQLKDALVASNSEAAGKAADQLTASLKRVEGCENTSKVAKAISRSNDLKEQRKQFTLLTSDIIPLVKQTQITAGSIFVQYCPMANDGDGGYWLASEPEVRNPYYGDEMLNCGEVKEEFKPNAK